MAALVHLSEAARLAGKSEITLRRLIKAGKLEAHREQTHSGFLYMVDADAVKAHYAGTPERARRAPVSRPKPARPAAPAQQPQASDEPSTVTSGGKVRVAVAGAHGTSADYWAKRAEAYEERYHKELERSSDLREELGLWRGRAEHAQALLLKLLPPPGTVEISAPRSAPGQPAEPPRTVTTRRLTFAGMMVLIALPLAVLCAVAAYLILTM